MAEAGAGNALMTPFTKFNFRAEINGVAAAHFTEISGFDASVDVIEYRTGDSGQNWPQKFRGLTKFGNVTFKWGLVEDDSFYSMLKEVSNGTADEYKIASVTISLLDDDGSSPVATWVLTNAWPCKYTAPDFNASSSEIAFESIEMAFESMERTTT